MNILEQGLKVSVLCGNLTAWYSEGQIGAPVVGLIELMATHTFVYVCSRIEYIFRLFSIILYVVVNVYL